MTTHTHTHTHTQTQPHPSEPAERYFHFHSRLQQPLPGHGVEVSGRPGSAPPARAGDRAAAAGQRSVRHGAAGGRPGPDLQRQQRRRRRRRRRCVPGGEPAARHDQLLHDLQPDRGPDARRAGAAAGRGRGPRPEESPDRGAPVRVPAVAAGAAAAAAAAPAAGGDVRGRGAVRPLRRLLRLLARGHHAGLARIHDGRALQGDDEGGAAVRAGGSAGQPGVGSPLPPLQLHFGQRNRAGVGERAAPPNLPPALRGAASGEPGRGGRSQPPPAVRRPLPSPRGAVGQEERGERGSVVRRRRPVRLLGGRSRRDPGNLGAERAARLERHAGGLWERRRLRDFPHQLPRRHRAPSLPRRRGAHPDGHGVLRLRDLLHVLRHDDTDVLPRSIAQPVRPHPPAHHQIPALQAGPCVLLWHHSHRAAAGSEAGRPGLHPRLQQDLPGHAGLVPGLRLHAVQRVHGAGHGAHQCRRLQDASADSVREDFGRLKKHEHGFSFTSL